MMIRSVAPGGFRRMVAGVGILTAFACGDEPTQPRDITPDAVVIEAGDHQSGVVGTELAAPLVVRVVNANQQPIPNQIINFRVIRGDGSVFAGAALTDSEGLARERWTLGTSVTDSQVVEARAVDNATGAALVFARFVATAVAGSPAGMTIVSGDGQSAIVRTMLPDSLRVRVRDTFGNLVPNATVTWSIVSGGGALSGPTSTTSAAGEATIAWTLGDADGLQLAEARINAMTAVTFSATATPEPVTLTKIAGDDQVAAPGAAVSVAPAVRALDTSNNPKAGVPIVFAVTSGGGSATGTSVITDENGVATVGSWTLGTAGTNTLTATSPSGHAVVFSATASAAILAGIAVHDGNNQTASLGAPVSVAPAARVTTAEGQPVAGATVTFEVGVGGGSITGATAISDQFGVARVGSWTLGNVTGSNTLIARLANGASATFTASAVQRSGDISVSITQPSTSLIGDTVLVRASVTSTHQLASVVAQIGGVVTPLTAQSGVWQGTVVITSLPRDTASLLVRATDINGAATEAIRVYTHDRKPRVIVTAPANLSVARPSLHVTATCDDDDPTGCVVSVRSDGVLLAGPATSLDQDINLQGFEGKEISLVIDARDSRNQATAVVRQVFVESSAKLALVAAVSGKALDLMGTRVLGSYIAAPDTFVIVQDFQSGVADTIRYAGLIARAALTPTGAAFSATLHSAPYSRIYIHRSGYPLTVRDLNSSSSFAASGPFVIYNTYPVGSGPLMRFNTTTGVEEQIAASAGNTENDVADNGDVAYWAPYNVYRYRNGTTTAITSDDGTTTWNTYPLTDGTNIVFRRHVPCCGLFWPMDIALYDGATITILASHPNQVSPGYDYDVNNGWTAFTKRDVGGVSQVWSRSPAGTMRQVSSFGSPSSISALGADGSVVFDNGGNRYYAGPGSAAVRVSSTLGFVRWRDGRFVSFVGNSAFAIVP